ncbi:MAG: (Fe-S)-binding protein [Gammaproteobacteria bacterium]|nr:(Fe-S)-binding protein [Gammaproteobacteria bacterium]MDH5727975.1 (Fe-S)-binding protein [Gammaproteobacteria bacterium]
MKIPNNPQTNTLLELSKQCVFCGLCSQYCPTYGYFQDENESPRGRISLIQGLASGQLQADATLAQSLDHCLGCQTCERICPSQVQFGQIMTLARPLYIDKLDKPWLNRQIVQQLKSHSPGKTQKLAKLIKLARKALPKYLFQNIDKLESNSKAAQTTYLKQRTNAEKINIFTGCAQSVFDQQAISDTNNILQSLGYEPVINPEQSCCGALALRQDDQTNLQHCNSHNQKLLIDPKITTTVFLTSACGARLRQQFEHQFPQHQIIDLSTFLLSRNIAINFKALKQRVLLHTPCSQKALPFQTTTSELIGSIPGITLIPITSSCCGAGGSHQLDYPDMSQAIGNQLIDQIIDAQANILLTSNIGCFTHLQSLLNKRGVKIQVMNPVTLIRQQLIEENYDSAPTIHFG